MFYSFNYFNNPYEKQQQWKGKATTSEGILQYIIVPVPGLCKQVDWNGGFDAQLNGKKWIFFIKPQKILLFKQI